MPHLAHAMNDTPLNGTPACSTDRGLHVVIATEAVQFSVLFPAFGSQCFSTVVAVEVMRVDHLELVHNVVTMDWETAFLAELLRSTFHFSVAFLAERPSLVLHKANVC